MKLVFILNSAKNLLIFRKELVSTLSQKHKIIIICPYEKDLTNLIFSSEFRYININRKSKNPFKELIIFIKIYKLLKNIKPDYVLNFTIKPNIYGSLICKYLNIKNINTITGLGNIYINKNLINNLIFFLYKAAVKNSYFNLFHNKDDLEVFTKNKFNNKKFGIVNGSGIDLNLYNKANYPNDSKNIKILFIGRIIKEKGIIEYCESAKILKANYKNLDFYAAGVMEDKNIKKQLKRFIDKKTVNFIGHINNISNKIAESHLVVLPSYREGLSHSLLISCSIGRPIITTNVPGCKEIVTHGFNGYLCHAKNYKSLVFYIEKFLKLSLKSKIKMAKNSVSIIDKYDIRNIISVYDKLIS